jgi:hypothetical protein
MNVGSLAARSIGVGADCARRWVSPPAPGRRASRATVRRAGRAGKHLTSWGSAIRFTVQVGLD